MIAHKLNMCTLYFVACAHFIIFLGVLNLDIITSTPPLEYLHCLFVCNSNRFHSFIFKLCIMIVHTLKMYTDDAGPEQSFVLFHYMLTCEILVFVVYHSYTHDDVSSGTRGLISLARH